MKNFQNVLKFEFVQFLKNKLFIGITLFLVAAIGVVMFFPRLTDLFAAGGESDAEREIMLVSAEAPMEASVLRAFTEAFPHYDVQKTDAEPAAIREKIAAGEADCAFIVSAGICHKYYADTVALQDPNVAIATAVLQQLYQSSAMLAGGLSPEQVETIMTTQVIVETENLRAEQINRVLYTTIMIYALFMVIPLYGQQVATNVAAEKGNRSMELLITSVKTTPLMFGKILATCLAGLLQLIAVFGSAIGFYHCNLPYWQDNALVASLFHIPVELLLYMLLFFVLGFLLFACLYGVIGAFASNPEETSTLSLPLMVITGATFLCVQSDILAGNVDSSLMQICSYIPLTAPMAMFTRICLGTVAAHEIAISIGILAASIGLVGVFSARVYRVGVLLYGTPPRISAILKALRKH